MRLLFLLLLALLVSVSSSSEQVKYSEPNINSSIPLTSFATIRCLNGGTPIHLNNRGLCECVFGWYGIHCQIPKCQMGLRNSSLNVCECYDGWNGTFCNIYACGTHGIWLPKLGMCRCKQTKNGTVIFDTPCSTAHCKPSPCQPNPLALLPTRSPATLPFPTGKIRVQKREAIEVPSKMGLYSRLKMIFIPSVICVSLGFVLRCCLFSMGCDVSMTTQTIFELSELQERPILENLNAPDDHHERGDVGSDHFSFAHQATAIHMTDTNCQQPYSVGMAEDPPPSYEIEEAPPSYEEIVRATVQ